MQSERTIPRGSLAAGANRARHDDVLAAMDALRHIVRALRVFSHTTRERLSVSGAQLFVLRCIEEEPGLSLKALSRRTTTDPSSVSVVVNRLCAAGWIKRTTAADDARRSHLAITARGRALLCRAPPVVQTRLIEGLRALPPRELASVSRALGKLALRVGAEPGAPPMFFEPERVRGSASPERARGAERRRRRVGH